MVPLTELLAGAKAYGWSSVVQSTRGIFGGGNNNTALNVIDYVEIETLGNATDFGDLTITRFGTGCAASTTRAVWAGGFSTSGGATSKVIDYVTMASIGNATSFGILSAEFYRLAGCSSSTRGIFSVGSSNSSGYMEIEYITIASTGNSTNFGNITEGREKAGAASSPVRGVFAGGIATAGSDSTTIDYVTIASIGNATDFGDLLDGGGDIAGCANSTRALFASAFINNNTGDVQYITIASTGNSTNFGNLPVHGNAGGSAYAMGASASPTRALFAGGGGFTNIIEYVTIASTGNGSDFGDLTIARQYVSGSSSNHGGLAA